MFRGVLQYSVGPSWLPVWPLLVLAGTLVSLGIALGLARPRGAWGRRLRSRLFLGIPWGTLLTVLAVGAIYLFVQDGFTRNPLVLPFRAWSYFYPLGIVTAPFTHAGPGHVTGNLFGTLVFAPIAEYAWSHFPTRRGSHSFGGLGSHPFVRILLFPVGVVLIGLLTGLFSVGPVIGFSGVVFAFAGFALVWYPIGTIIAMSGLGVVTLVLQAMANPVETAQVGTRFVTPWWAGIAVQGHGLGLLLGVLVGGFLLARRNNERSPGRLWIALLLFAVARGLWAIYVPGEYVLFRAAGVVVVFLLAALITAAITASDRQLIERIDLRRHEAAVGLLLCVTLAVSAVAVPVNLVTVSEEPFAERVEVADYTVTYAENVSDQYTPAVDLPGIDQEIGGNTSGVIVVSERRTIFWTVVSKSRLAFEGQTDVVVGGPGWRETVGVNRTGWQAAGNDTVYKVFLDPPHGNRSLAFSSDRTTVEPRIANRRIHIAPTNDSFAFVVTENNQTLGQATLPAVGSNRTAGGVRFNRTEQGVFAERNGTRVKIARRE